MLTKSMMGYAVAFVVAIIVYRFVIKGISVYFSKTRDHKVSHVWIGLQVGVHGISVGANG